MKRSFVLTFSLLLQIGIIVGIGGSRISQEKCDQYKFDFNNGNRQNFSFMVRVYNGDYVDGVLISENFVLTFALNGTEKLVVIIEALKLRYNVTDHFENEEQNIMLLKLHKSVELNNQIRPACLPQSPTIGSSKLTEICWPNAYWLHKLELKITSYEICKKNTFDYNKDLYIKGVKDGTSLCTHVEFGDRRECNKPGATLLNDHQEIIGIASEISYGNVQTFIKVSDYVSWIENIVWPRQNERTTTEEQFTWSTIPAFTTTSSQSSTTEETSTASYTTEETSTASSTTEEISTASSTMVERSTIPSENGATIAATKTDENIKLSQIVNELHEIHLFLNVNLIVIVLILVLVLFIACILWSDGFCINAVLPDRSSSISTDV